MTSAPGTGLVQVWDPWVRVLHWSPVAGFTTTWLSGEGEALRCTSGQATWSAV